MFFPKNKVFSLLYFTMSLQNHTRSSPTLSHTAITQILSHVRMLPKSEDFGLAWNNSDQYQSWSRMCSALIFRNKQTNKQTKQMQTVTNCWIGCYIMQAYSHPYHPTLSAGTPMRKIPESNHDCIYVFETLYHSPIWVFYLREGFITRLWLSWRSWMS